jgi:hypothetical protein
VPLFGLAAVLLVPWVVGLVLLLPSAHRSAHWDIAWSGFDVILALLLTAVAVAAWRGSLWFEGAATAAATLLFVDAWFDVLTSSSRTELLVAVGEAVFVELPLAVLCLLLARDAERRLPAFIAVSSALPSLVANEGVIDRDVARAAAHPGRGGEHWRPAVRPVGVRRLPHAARRGR